MSSATRAPRLLKLSAASKTVLASRAYATQTSLGTTSAPTGPKRRAVTPFNDNGRVPWGQLSGAEKVARTTQQSFNFGLIILGGIATV